MNYTKEQREFLIRKYGESYLSAKNKVQMIEELGSDAYDMNGLKPEFQLTFEEKATLSMPEELFSDLIEEKGKGL